MDGQILLKRRIILVQLLIIFSVARLEFIVTKWGLVSHQSGLDALPRVPPSPLVCTFVCISRILGTLMKYFANSLLTRGYPNIAIVSILQA